MKTIELEEASSEYKAKEDKKTKSELDEESRKQEFFFDYKREHTIAYLYKKMPYNYMIVK